MLRAINMNSDGLVIEEPITKITSQSIKEARQKYASFRRQGIILSDYSEDIWVLTNQTSRIKIRFSNQKKELDTVLSSRSISYMYFVDRLKIYVILRLGTCMIETMRAFVLECIRNTITSNCYSNDIIPKENVDHAVLSDYINFVRLISPKSEDYLSACEKLLQRQRIAMAQNKQNNKTPCVLNEFQSYFELDRIIDEWWSSHANTQQKNYYYPFFLFWKITTILPLRVTEFCVTPHDCINRTDNNFYLTIRRSRLKGYSSFLPKIHKYTIDADYEKHTYEIPEWLYNVIDLYRKNSNGFFRNYDLLFSLDFMYANKDNQPRKLPESTSIFSDKTLGELLSDFYNEIIIGLYGYNLITESELQERYMDDCGSYELKEKEIMTIQSKHTRHLALINLVLRGCNPMIVKEFAGHTSEAMSSHYYTNFANLTRTTTMRLYYQSKSYDKRPRAGSITSIPPASTLINQEDEYVEVDAGKCYSKAFLSGQITDCSSCSGNCRNCRYLIPWKKDGYQELTESINKEIAYIANMLKSPDIEARITEYQLRHQRLLQKNTNLAARIWQEEEIKHES